MDMAETGVGRSVSRSMRRATAAPVLVIGVHETQSKYLADVLGAREAGVPLLTWCRDKGYTVGQAKSAQRLQAKLRRRGEALVGLDCRPVLRSLRAEILDRVKRRAGVGTAAFVADLGALREIEAALRQAAVWERQDRAGGCAPAPAAPSAACGGASVRGTRGARIGAAGVAGGRKAGVEASVGALSVGVAGGSAVDCAVEASAGVVEALGGGIGEGEGDEGGVLLSVPLAGC